MSAMQAAIAAGYAVSPSLRVAYPTARSSSARMSDFLDLAPVVIVLVGPLEPTRHAGPRTNAAPTLASRVERRHCPFLLVRIRIERGRVGDLPETVDRLTRRALTVGQAEFG